MERLFDYVFSTPYELRLFVAVFFTLAIPILYILYILYACIKSWQPIRRWQHTRLRYTIVRNWELLVEATVTAVKAFCDVLRTKKKH